MHFVPTAHLPPDNSTTNRLVPVAVNTTPGVSALAGKSVVAISAGFWYSLALCSDGTVVTWGVNTSGQLGDNSTTNRLVPVAVNTTPGLSALAGKSVVAISAGGGHSLALCSDGTLVAWGYSDGQLGDGTTGIYRIVPVAVNTDGGTSVLFGKTVVAISAGYYHSLALCSDGTVAAWGNNGFGRLGDNSTTNRLLPVAVNTASGISALFGKTVVAISGGGAHNLVRCADGSLVTWGYNGSGRLGDGTTTNRSVPVLVDTSFLSAGEIVTRAFTGIEGNHNLGLAASPVPPFVNALAATNITTSSATLHGTVNANATPVGVTFEYGTDVSYGTTVPGTPATVTGVTTAAVAATITDLAPGSVYHFRINAGRVHSPDATFTTLSDNNHLASLALSVGTLTPAFSSGTTSYTASVPHASASVTVTPTTADALATVTVNGAPVASGSASGALPLVVGANTVTVRVTAQDTTAKTYTVTVMRATPGQPLAQSILPVASPAVVKPASPPFSLFTGASSGLPVTYAVLTGPATISSGGLVTLTGVAGAVTVRISQAGSSGYDPAKLYVTFQVVTSGQEFVKLARGPNAGHFAGIRADGTLWTWGSNGSGQLGDGSTTQRLGSVQVGTANIWATVDCGQAHTLAVKSDGTLWAWGNNYEGQLGTGTVGEQLPSPLQVGTASNWAMVACGQYHTVAMKSDGTLWGWGRNGNGQLGDGTGTTTNSPVQVGTANNWVTVASGADHALALKSDGTLWAWGHNGVGQLGDGSTTQRLSPVQVGTANNWATVACGAGHTLAVKGDGTLWGWGDNQYGQLGDGTTTQRLSPVQVGTASNWATVGGGQYHTLALKSDGTLWA